MKLRAGTAAMALLPILLGACQSIPDPPAHLTLDAPAISFGRLSPGEGRSREVVLRGVPVGSFVEVRSIELVSRTEPASGTADVIVKATPRASSEQHRGSVVLQAIAGNQTGYFGGIARVETNATASSIHEVSYCGWVVPEREPEAGWSYELSMDTDLEDTHVQITPVPYKPGSSPEAIERAEACVALLRHGTEEQRRQAVEEAKAVGDPAVPVLISAYAGLDMGERSDRVIGKHLDEAAYDILRKGNQYWFVDPPDGPRVKDGIEVYDQKAVNLWVRFYLASARNPVFWELVEERRKKNAEAQD